MIHPKFKSDKSGAAKLIRTLWHKFGGATYLNKQHFPDFKPQNFVNWRDRGKVPLLHVTRIANKLKIPKWGLNYEELSAMFPNEIPSWTEVVKSYNLPKLQTEQILFLAPPRKRL